jgi:outer membrane lipoprotein SlyB
MIPPERVVTPSIDQHMGKACCTVSHGSGRAAHNPGDARSFIGAGEMTAMRTQSCLSFLFMVSFVSACASPGGGSVYSRGDAQRPWTVQTATVVEVSEATIEGRESVIGTAGGGFIGYELGHAVGHGAGSGVAGAVGAVAGAIVGQQAEKAATRQKAWEILVEIEHGAETIAIVQPADQTFTAGEKVRVYTRADGAARVAKL